MTEAAVNAAQPLALSNVAQQTAIMDLAIERLCSVSDLCSLPPFGLAPQIEQRWTTGKIVPVDVAGRKFAQANGCLVTTVQVICS